MTNPLRNNAVVACFVVIAGLGVAANVFHFRLPVSAAAPAAVLDPIAAEEKFEVPPPLGIAQELRSWASSLAIQPARDPFAWPHRPSPVSTNAPSGPIPAFRLQAVSIDGDQALAVLNQRILAVGEKLGDYAVERILPRAVWMRGPAGLIVVHLAR